MLRTTNSELNDEDVDDVLPMVLTQIEYCADAYVVGPL